MGELAAVLGDQGGSSEAYPGALLELSSSKLRINGYFFIHYNYKLSRSMVIMSGKIKISSDMMRCYDGTGDDMTWLKKGKLVVKLMEIKDIASFISLYLEGDAKALYFEMSEVDQLNASKIEGRLKEAFAQGSFEAYRKLKGL